MWIYALTQFGHVRPGYHERALALVREIHRPFVEPERGVWWKMEEDLSAPYSGYGFGALATFHGYVVYRLLAPEALAAEIAEMEALIEQQYHNLEIQQDLGLGMMLRITHFFPDALWATLQRQRALAMLAQMWISPPGYFCRQPSRPDMKFAFTNYGVGLGLQTVGEYPERVRCLQAFFRTYRSHDAYDVDVIIHIMACTSHFPGPFLNTFDPSSST